MVPNRITRGAAARRALVPFAAAAVLAVGLGACGGDGGGGGTTVAEEKAADAETLNGVLGRQLGAVKAYDRTVPLLHGSALAAAREFRAQEQEHADATIKALRVLASPAEAEPEAIDSEGLKTQDDALAFLYELESKSLAYNLRALARLNSQRVLVGSVAANQAQHLVVLRRALGADLDESIPSAFETGITPPPSNDAER